LYFPFTTLKVDKLYFHVILTTLITIGLKRLHSRLLKTDFIVSSEYALVTDYDMYHSNVEICMHCVDVHCLSGVVGYCLHHWQQAIASKGINMDKLLFTAMNLLVTFFLWS